MTPAPGAAKAGIKPYRMPLSTYNGRPVYQLTGAIGLFPNPRRPGIGLRPRHEAQRPLLPQHARHCPVLEAGSSAGFLIRPPLAEKESFQIGYGGEGRYQFVCSVSTKGNNWEPVFTVTYLLPVGGIGATEREIKLHIQDTPKPAKSPT